MNATERNLMYLAELSSSENECPHSIDNPYRHLCRFWCAVACAFPQATAIQIRIRIYYCAGTTAQAFRNGMASSGYLSFLLPVKHLKLLKHIKPFKRLKSLNPQSAGTDISYFRPSGSFCWWRFSVVPANSPNPSNHLRTSNSLKLSNHSNHTGPFKLLNALQLL